MLKGNSTQLFTALEYDENWIKAFIFTGAAIAPAQTYNTDRLALAGHLIAPKLDGAGILAGDLAASECDFADTVRGYSLARDIVDLSAETAEGFHDFSQLQLEEELLQFSQGFGNPYLKGKAISAYRLFVAEYESDNYLSGINAATPAGTELTSSAGRIGIAGAGEFVIGELECHIAPHVSTNPTRIRVNFNS
jgi:hypothetical protein